MNEKKFTSSNKKAFKVLSKRYASITMKEIEIIEKKVKYELWMGPYGQTIAAELTKFSTEDCPLCVSTLDSSCHTCHWTVKTNEGCGRHITFKDIYHAKDKYVLKEAFEARSKYMNEFL